MMPAFLIALSFLVSSEQPLQPTGKDRHAKPIRYAAFSPDSQSLATASMDGTVRVWNVEDCRLQRTLSVEEGRRRIPYQAVTYDSTGTKLAAVSRQAPNATLMTVWDSRTGEHLKTLSAKFHTVSTGVTGIAFSPDDSEVFCVANRYAYFWNLKQETSATQFLVTHLQDGKAFYRDGMALVVCGHEGVQCINARTALDVFRRRKDTIVWGDIPKGGKFLGLTYDGFLEVIDQGSFKVDRRFQPKNGSAHYCTLTADRESVVLMTESGVIERWKLNAGTYAGRLKNGVIPASPLATSISWGSGKAQKEYYGRHPTPLLVSSDGKTICYVAGIQFALLPAQWTMDE